MSERSLTIDIYSDRGLPLVLYREAAAGAGARIGAGAERARVFWRPFQLNPTMPKAGMDRRVS
ncbi:MAG: hypothetical protein MRJ92_13205 [Nitrospira sp.]|nr:hypothetical protein [Nitrospira sp.]